MALIRNRALSNDAWQPEPESGALPPGDVIVSGARWLAERDTLRTRGGHLGLRLTGGDDLAAFSADLECFDLVELHFAAFTDGRGFSQARQLRERYGFAGELRASGELLPDQLRELERCGVDSVRFPDQPARLLSALGSYRAFDVTLQPAADGELVFRRRYARAGDA